MSFPTSIKRIIIVAEENRDYSTVMANSFFAGLANTYSNLTNYKNILHPSQPNYFAVTSGSSQGCTNDSCSVNRNVDNIFRQVKNTGLTFGTWVESGSPTKHNPGEFYTDSSSSQKNFTDFQTNYINGSATPPNFCFVSPNLNNDAHDGTLAQAATWLQNTFKLSTLQAKPWGNETAFIIWFDESGSGSLTYCCIISPLTLGKKSSVSYNHYNTLSTAMWLLGITTTLNNADASKAMKDIFGSITPSILTSIVVAPTSVSVGIGSTTQLTATCKDQNGGTMTCPTLTWSSNDTSKVTVDSTGKVLGIATGTANVTTKSGTIVSNISTITVTSLPILTSIAIAPVAASINISGTVQLTATCKDQNNNTIMCPNLVWVSSDSTKATVNSTGKVTGVAAGVANVTAKSGTIVSNSSTITVSTTPSGIVVTTPSVGLVYNVGESRVVRWTHAAGTGANVKIELLKAGTLSKTISSSTPNDNAFAWTIPSVSTGNDYQVRITDLSNAQNTGISGNFTIQGSNPVLTSIAVAPGTATVDVGISVQLGATCKDQNGGTMTCTGLTWISSDPTKATVDPTGKVTGIATGTANVMAKSGTITSNASVITVIQPVDKKFSVNDVAPGSVINNTGVAAILDPSGTFTKDQACVEVCRLLSLI